MKISVIMAATLREYPGCATNREMKFIRAVQSFRNQWYADAELIIVSDGCEGIRSIYQNHDDGVFKNDSSIKFVMAEQGGKYFTGTIRQQGINIATGEYVCYLDSDDVIAAPHLCTLAEKIRLAKNPAWVYYDEYIGIPALMEKGVTMKRVKPRFGSIGTSSICHKRELPVSWEGMDGYGHDWGVVQQLLAISKGQKVKDMSYCICHWPGTLDM